MKFLLSSGLWIRVLGTTGLLYLAFQDVEWARLTAEVGEMNVLGVVSALVVLCIIRVLMSFRLQIVSATCGYRVSFSDAIAMVLSSSLASFVLPGGVATDVVRGYQLNSLHGDARSAIATVAIDRYFGIVAILIIGAIAGYTYRDTLPSSIYPIFTGVLLGSLLVPVFGNTLARYLPSRPTLLSKIKDLVQLITNEIRPNRLYAQLWLISTVIQILRCTIFVALFHAFEIDVNPYYAFVFVPIMFIVIMLPISLGGLGVRESILILLFSPMGASPEALVLTGLTAHLLELATSSPGAWYFIRGLPGNRAGAERLPK